MTVDVQFIDHGRTAQEKPDPKYPDGIHIDLRTNILQKYCSSNLPFPAPRCGLYAIKCRTCGFTAAITVAGRPDDPKIVTMPCRAKGMN